MKKHNWHVDFCKYIEDNKNTEFKWGEFDCALFAANCVMLMTGEDPGSAIRGKYTDEVSAKKVLLKEYGTLEQAWDSQLQRIETCMVQRGDVVVFNGDNGLTSGIYWNGGAYAPSEHGVAYVRDIHYSLIAAWRV